MPAIYGEDPTPCPLPRHGLGQQVRRSSIFADGGSGGMAHGVSLIAAKPRRPQKRQSVGWDPTVDIFEDTVNVQHRQAMRQTSEPRVEVNFDRRQSVLAFPTPETSRGSEHDGTVSDATNARKRRLSSIVAPQCAVKTTTRPRASLAPCTANAGPGSTIGREARRRTIYVPSEDTTILTIHPGGSLRDEPNQRRPRRSDVFLDILSEEENQSEKKSAESRPSPEAAPRKRTSRSSLAAPARRVPLQPSMRQIQEKAQPVERPGRGDGQENEPPNALKGIKRLGKRASFIMPEKPTQRPFTGLDTLTEQSPPRSSPENHHRSTNVRRPAAGTTSSPASRRIKPWDERQSMRAGHTSILPRSEASSVRRGSLPVAAGVELRSLRSETVPTSLSAPRLSMLGPKPHETYPVITEDIADPSMYEDNWLSQQEQSMTQLVNSLFERTTNSSHKHASLDSQISLRQTLLDVYHGGDNPLLHKRLQASLQFGALSIPPQTLHQVARFKDDVGQRQRFLDLWTKTYDLELLQTAAEVVIGRRAACSSRNSDEVSRKSSPRASKTKTLNAFLRTFLVNNDDIARPPPHVDGPDLMNVGRNTAGIAVNWRRTVLRSLMLIHLLDTAKSVGIAKSTLFQSTSPYKSSLNVLQGLCRLLVPSVGDVSRVLGHLGYHVGYIQYPLEEYDYQVTNLATDLRDGVRLTRLVESLLYPSGSLGLERTTSGASEPTITMPCGDVLSLCPTAATTASASPREPSSSASTTTQSYPLSQHLKYPCLSRPQKIYNVQLALAALSSVTDVGNLLSDLKAEDIVDGHREKTVRLLWGLVSRWGLSSLVDFGLVEREIRRTAREWRRRSCGVDTAAATEAGSVAENTAMIDPLEADINAELPYLTGLERHTALLKSWAAHTARLHGVQVTNLSTSFADGRAYKAIVDEYAACLPVSTTSQTLPREIANDTSPASSTRSATTARSGGRSTGTNAPLQPPHIGTLQSLGCSRSFLHLFSAPLSTSISTTTKPTKTTASTIPSSKTTVPLLSFLASRLLPPAAPYFAALTLQRFWRRATQRLEMRRRLRAVVLARACAEVVGWRARIEAAAVVIQRRWRRVCWL